MSTILLDIMLLSAAAALLAAAVYKVVGLRRHRRAIAKTSFVVGLASLSAAAALYSPAGYTWFDAMTGVPNLAELAGHAAILLSAWQAQALALRLDAGVASARRRVRVRGLFMAAVLALLTALFLLAATPVSSWTFLVTYADSATVLGYWVVFAAAFTVSLVDVARLSRSSPARGECAWLSLGLNTVAVGCVTGIVAVGGVWTAYAAARAAGATPPLAFYESGRVVASVGMVVLAAGATMPAWGRRLGPGPRAWWASGRSHRRLYVLWRDLRRSCPEIVLSRRGRDGMWMLSGVNTVECLHRRVVEINDARRVLTGFMRGATATSAAVGAAGGDATAAAEAAALRSAIAAKAASMPATTTSAAKDPGGDVAWLERVAAAYRLCPSLTAIRPAPGTGRRLMWARWVTEATSPAVLASVLLVVVTVRASPAAAVRAAVAVLFVSALPLAVVLAGVRRGRWTDHHLRDRTQRQVPLVVAMGSLGVGCAVLLVWQAPRDLLALVSAMGVGLLTVLIVTHWWKISVHSAVAAGTVTVLVAVLGPLLLLLAPLAAVSGWSRTVLDDHTPAQVLAGLLLGTVVAAAVFPPLR